MILRLNRGIASRPLITVKDVSVRWLCNLASTP
jgi:hypothetical protein